MKKVAICLVILFVMAGCFGDVDRVSVEGRIPNEGDILIAKLSGEKVQVLNVAVNVGWAFEGISCRVQSGRNYRDGLVSADSYVGEYARVLFRGYELEWPKEEE